MIHPLFKPYEDKLFPLDPILKDMLKRLGEKDEKINCKTLLLRNRLDPALAEKLYQFSSGADWEWED